MLPLFFVSSNALLAVDTIPTQIPDLEEQVDVTVSPEFPQPNEAVVITLDAYGIDLNNSNITWTSNGSTVLQGKGEKVLNIVAPKQGQIVTIKALINAPNSKPIERSVTINPQSVDIIWESETYTPPFYKGKTMFSPQEKLKLVAMPTGSNINQTNAIYKWTQDGEVLGNKSGFGKNVLTYTGDILANQVDFGVEASNGNKNIARNSMSIAPLNPEVYLYEKSALYGTLFNRELSTLFDLGTKQEGTLSIYPFFYGVVDRNDGKLAYQWTTNNIIIDVPAYQNDMTFRNVQNVDGKSTVGIKVTNTDNFLEEVEKETLINFNKSNSGFSF